MICRFVIVGRRIRLYSIDAPGDDNPDILGDSDHSDNKLAYFEVGEGDAKSSPNQLKADSETATDTRGAGKIIQRDVGMSSNLYVSHPLLA